MWTKQDVNFLLSNFTVIVFYKNAATPTAIDCGHQCSWTLTPARSGGALRCQHVVVIRVELFSP